jgi:hypothetical protein
MCCYFLREYGNLFQFSFQKHNGTLLEELHNGNVRVIYLFTQKEKKQATFYTNTSNQFIQPFLFPEADTEVVGSHDDVELLPPPHGIITSPS